MDAWKKRTTSLAAVIVAGAAAVGCTHDTGPQGVEPARVTTPTSSNEAALNNRRGFVENIDSLTTKNHDYRRVVYTSRHMQLVLMAIAPGEDIGAEVHDVDQFFRVEAGTGEVVINDRRTPITAETAIVVPAGARHNVINTGKDLLQVYTLYAPPHHRDKVVHSTKANAEGDAEHFDGTTTE